MQDERKTAVFGSLFTVKSASFRSWMVNGAATEECKQVAGAGLVAWAGLKMAYEVNKKIVYYPAEVESNQSIAECEVCWTSVAVIQSAFGHATSSVIVENQTMID